MSSERDPLAPLEYVLAAYGLLYFLFDREGTYLDYRAGEERDLFVPPESFLGRNIREVLPEADAAAFLAAVGRVVDRGVPETYEYALSFPDGARHFEARIVPAGPGRVASFTRNVTEQRRLEERLLQTQKLESIGRLAGGVAHDFNNLLTAILGYAELLEGELAPDSRGRGWLDEVRRGGERARDLTRQLLAFARRQRIAPRPTDLNELASGLRNLLSRLLGERIVLDTRLAEGIAPVLADPAQIEQVVMNLSLNARDAMPEGGTLTIATREVPEAERADGRWVELSVRDTGSGMDPETLEHLFEPFFTTKDVGEGTGLGLATVYGIVRQSGGVIEVDSEPGAGSTFRILLPKADLPVASPPARPAPAPRGGSETILVVEDDPAVRAWTVESLRTAGYRVVEAVDGEAALAIASRIAPDALVSDVVMPRLGGAELARRLRATRPDLHVLLVSGYAPATETPFVERAAFLQKPFTRARLLDTLRRILDA